MSEFGDYRIERISAARVDDLLTLLEGAYPGDRVDRRGRQLKFDTSWTGLRDIGYFAYHGERPAAHYAVFPVWLRHRGERILGAQSGDTVTHPAHVRRGLFGHLAERTYELARQSGIELLYGLPNPASHPGFVKMGWTTTGPMTAWVDDSPSRRRLRRLALRAWPGARSLGPATRISPEQLVAAPLASLGGELSVERSIEFYRYRSYSAHDLVMCPSGAAWISVRPTEIFIGDLYPRRVDAAAELWKELREVAVALGLLRLVFHASANLDLRWLLRLVFHASANLDLRWLQPLATRSEGLPVIVKPLGATKRIDPAALTLTLGDYDTF